MADYTDDDVTRLTEILADQPGCQSYRAMARYLLAQGVTLPPPPPDPAVVVVKYLRGRLPEPALRDLFTTDALKAAAAKVQEADRGE